jgi:hypothetical protein
MKCDFCEVNESVGAYATDHGPFSLCYCEECLKHPNLRTMDNALSKWGRFGDRAFDEYASEEWSGCEPQVYYNGNYIPLRELVDIIDEDFIINNFPNESPILTQIINRFKETK